MERAVWYLRRLRSMSPQEIVWRAGRNATGRVRTLRGARTPTDAAVVGLSPDWSALFSRFQAATGRPMLLDRRLAAQLAARHPQLTDAVVAAADRALAGRFQYFGYPEFELGSEIDWNRDPLTEVRWPAIPAGRIDYRTARGDPKLIWELHRLQHLPLLAQAWLYTGADRYADVALNQLDSWLDQNPIGIGIAWRGAFEAGMRAISVAVALHGLRDAPSLTPARYRRVLRMLAGSAELCWRERSLHSSANNHLIGEMTGLATVALLHPELTQAALWERRAMLTLELHADRLILPDGAAAEQAIAYQVFTAELLLLVEALRRARGDRASTLSDAVQRSAGYLAALVGRADPVPQYGDDDDGFAIRLGAEPLRTVRAHLAAVATVTGWAPGFDLGEADLAAGWLGRLQPEPCAAAPPTVVKNFHAPHGGVVVLRSGGRRITMDVGPLGYLAIAAHGHADALAITVSADGREILGDPGTASYYQHPARRMVHRGTRVHGTVTLDGTDQSEMGGPFLWSRHAVVTVHAVDLDAGIVDAEHDGYTRLCPAAWHRRWLVTPHAAPWALVVDQVRGTGYRRVRASWPVHPDLDAVPVEGGHELLCKGEPQTRLTYAATAPWTADQIRGDQQRDLGWWSSRLEQREPAWLLGVEAAVDLPVTIVTMITRTDRAGALHDLSVANGRGSLDITWRDAFGPQWVEIDPDRPGAVQVGSPQHRGRPKRSSSGRRPATVGGADESSA